MKKLLSILLLIVFSFNLGGYFILFKVLQHSVNRELVEDLDNNQYQNDQLLEIQVPISLPYVTYSGELKRINGKIEHNGEIYKLVKQKFINDTLHIYCIADKVEKRLIVNFKEYAKHTTDAPASQKKKPGQVVKQSSKEYHSFSDDFLNPRFGTIIVTDYDPKVELFSFSTKVPTPPPQA
jgi:hypothetical protein